MTAQPALITDAEWKRLTTPPAQATPDDGSILWAMQHKRCVVHRDRPGKPHDGEQVPYCDDCRKEHEERWTHLN